MKELVESRASLFAKKAAARKKDTINKNGLLVESRVLAFVDSLAAQAEGGILTLNDVYAFGEWALAEKPLRDTLKHILQETERYRFVSSARQRFLEMMMMAPES